MPADFTRRDFLHTSAAAVSVGLAAAASSSAVAAEAKKPAAAATTPATTQARKLNIGIVGVADQGWYHVNIVRKLENANIAALCDVDVRHLVRAARAIPDAEVYVDFREMLKMKDLDAVLVATPDHTHAVVAGAALRAGKHVYCEKPLCHTVREVRALTALAKKSGLVTQMGIQIHALDNYRRVVELIRAGAIGKVSQVHVWHAREHREMNRSIIQPPATFDYDLWLGPVSPRPLEADFHPYNWRRRWAFGAGKLGDIGCHLMDVAFWALDLRTPATVKCEGAPMSDEICTEWNIATYEFAARGAEKPGVTLTWYDPPKFPTMRSEWKLPKSLENEAVVFVGESGILATDYREHCLLPEARFKDFKRPPATIPPSPGHQAEWVNACLANDPSLCGAPFSYAGPLAETALLGIAAYRGAPGKTLEWNAANLRFPDAPEAERFLGYEYREGWVI